MFKKLLKRILHSSKAHDGLDTEVRLECAIKHIDTLEAMTDQHVELLKDLIDKMLLSPDVSIRDLARNIRPSIHGIAETVSALKPLRERFKTDKA